MRRAATALVVAAVATLVGVAALDAVRGGGAEPAARPDAAADAELVEELRAAGARGTLVYTDPQCRSLHAVRLPSLDGLRLPRGTVAEPCSFSLSPVGARVAPPHWRWSRDGARRAACRGRAVVDVVDVRTGAARTLAGCDPAWRPDGALTLVRDGAVVNERGDTVVPRQALLDAAARHPRTPASGRISGVGVVDLAWLDDETVAVGFTVRYPDGRVLPQQAVAAFERGRLAWLRPVEGPVERVETAADGRYLEVEPGRLLRRDGSVVALPPELAGAAALAVSPRGASVAGVVGGSVAVAPVEGGGVVRLPIAARDVAWR